MNGQQILGVVAAICGILVFIERGFFAALLLGARVLGNAGMLAADAEKVLVFAVAGGVVFVMGIAIVASGTYQKHSPGHSDSEAESGE